VENLIEQYESALAQSGMSPEAARSFDLAALWQAARDGIAVAVAD